jgi:hypothetical protein
MEGPGVLADNLFLSRLCESDVVDQFVVFVPSVSSTECFQIFTDASEPPVTIHPSRTHRADTAFE